MKKSPYPLFFRKLVLDYYLNSKNVKVNDVLDKYKISKGTLFNWIKLNELNKLPPKKRKSKFNEKLREYIKHYVIKRINFRMYLLIKNIRKIFNLSISRSSIYNILKIEKISFKKIKKKIIKRNIKKHKMELKNKLKKIHSINRDNIISIDETSFDTYLSSNYGWSKKGKEIFSIKQKNKYRYTVISSISNKKIIFNKIIKGSANKLDFLSFIKELTKSLDKKYILFMDNARIHHAEIVKKFIKKTKHEQLFNVPYSPELNPIEYVFSKVKSIIRNKKNDYPINLKKNIRISFSKITKNDLTNFYNHSFNKKC